MARRTPPKTDAEVDLDVEDIRLPDGTRLTEAGAEALAQEVRSRGGRPSLTGNAAASPRVTFRVTPDVRDRAEAIAVQEGKTISQLAREALEARIDVGQK